MFSVNCKLRGIFLYTKLQINLHCGDRQITQNEGSKMSLQYYCLSSYLECLCLLFYAVQYILKVVNGVALTTYGTTSCSEDHNVQYIPYTTRCDKNFALNSADRV